jgi:hypothetical protein
MPNADDLIDQVITLAAQLSLAGAPREPSRPEALEHWGKRIGAEAKRANWLAPRREQVGARLSTACLRRFMTGGGARSALDVAATPWLRITETQITRPLADFVNEDGPRRAMAFLRALPCAGVTMPDTFESGGAKAEVPAEGGRVDLLVTGRRGRKTYGAAVEVKIDQKLHNPLGSYARLALSEGLALKGRSKGQPTGALVVLARRATKATLGRLSRNHGWTFVHWSGFLRRFERELAVAGDDEEFRAFRRVIWDRFL